MLGLEFYFQFISGLMFGIELVDGRIMLDFGIVRVVIGYISEEDIENDK
jgi:hypothetical protein